MKKRILWKMFVLEIVTIGIYRLYYLIKTRKEMMSVNPNVKIKSPAFLILPVVFIIAAVVTLIWGIVAADMNRVPCGSPDASTTIIQSSTTSSFNTTGTQYCLKNGTSVAPAIGLLLFYPLILIGIIFFVIWEWSYSQAIEVVTNNKFSFALAMVILILVPDGIDILIVQDYFNKLEAPAAPVMPAQPPAIS